MRLGISATHPIQYHAPLYRQIAKQPEVDLTVYFCHSPNPEQQGVGFGIPFEWDLELTSGYPHQWLRNRSPKPSLTSFWGCNTPGLGEILRREAFDAFLVHGWNKLSCWQAFWGCRQTGTPLLVRGDSQLEAQHSTLKWRLKDKVYPAFIRKFDVCIATGKRSAQYFQHFGARNIVISPHIVDNAWFSEEAERARQRRTELRLKWNLNDDAFVFLFVGKFEQNKRPWDAMHSLERIIKVNERKVALLMVGDGDLRTDCQDAATKMSLPVQFTGFLNQSEMPAAYALSDCLLLCSASETWGLVVNEAMACGLPAIVSEACGCVPDLIIEGETGYSYRCGDVGALSRCMDRMAANPDLARHMGKSAFRHIQDYSVERAAQVIVEAVERYGRSKS